MIGLIWAFVVANYIPVIATYVGGGALYAVLKWTLTLFKLRRLVIDNDALPESERKPRSHIEGDLLGNYEYPPLVSSNKGRLFMWASFWPINLVYTMFADVAKEAWDFLYRKFGAVLQAIATSILPK
jgi:hypothetical protein